MDTKDSNWDDKIPVAASASCFVDMEVMAAENSSSSNQKEEEDE